MSVLVRVVEGYSPEGVIILEFDTDFRRPSVGGVVFQHSPSDKVAGEKQKINKKITIVAQKKTGGRSTKKKIDLCTKKKSGANIGKTGTIRSSVRISSNIPTFDKCRTCNPAHNPIGFLG